MTRNDIYFRLKPLIPRSTRLRIRRWFALRKRHQTEKIWPIMPGSESPPEGWPGWPDGKKFAFVLTHDVESQQGVDRVKDLAELEMEMGFRSSFNFVPEGAYSVPGQLLEWLRGQGFEIGVHDLQHDGLLYESRSKFNQKAARINRHLCDWGAVGFRSAFMLHKLDWLHELDIEYDASTFDTDPFEPQPDGVNTIFPFWVPREAEVTSVNSSHGSVGAGRDPSTFNRPRGGYVELPYTLPQDSTVFFILKQPNVLLWQKKLSWIADCGGMALLNVHPDFISFEDGSETSHSYPATLYAEFLRWVREEHAGNYWHTKPAAMAKYIRQLETAEANRGRSFYGGQASLGASDDRACSSESANVR